MVSDEHLSQEQSNKKATFLVKQYLKFLEADMKPGVAFANLVDLGYDNTKQHLRLHVKSFHETGRAIKEASGNRGRKRLLDSAQEAMVKAQVDSKNAMNLPTNHRKLIKFVRDTMNIDVSMSTIKRVENRKAVSKRRISKRCQKAKFTAEELTPMLWEWIVLQRRLRTFGRPPAEIFSFDVTTTKPPEEQWTLSSVGSGKQRSSMTVTINTDSIVTICSAGGGNPCPCICFTSNVRLSLDQKNTARGKAIRANLEEKLEFYNIDKSRVVYEKGSAYTAERADFYVLATKMYFDSGKISPNALVCHDGGNAFKPLGVSIFDGFGLDHVVYPAPVHQYLSPNDNKIHGIKSTWYHEYEDLDDVCRTLRLMQLLDEETERNSARYFRENIFNLKKSQIAKVITNRDVRVAKEYKFKRNEGQDA